MVIAQVISIVFAAYVLIGVAFGLYFVFKPAHVIDPAAKGTGFLFRLVIFFGSAGLWPFLLRKATGDAGTPVENNAHREAAGGAHD